MSKKSSSYFAKHFALFGLVAGIGMLFGSPAQAAGTCNRTLTADVVAFDMPLMWNRFGAQNINGQMFALRRDVVDESGKPLTEGGSATPGHVALRPDKRPRPLVLRLGAGDCLEYTVTNLLDPAPNPFGPPQVRSNIKFALNIDDQVSDRRISLHFQGTELVGSIDDDGSFVGRNASSLIAAGDSMTYKIRAPKEGTYLGTSYGATFGGEGLNGMAANGLWAVLNVGPVDSAFYRSQTTREELDLATVGYTAGTDGMSGNDDDQPLIDYELKYPLTIEPSVWNDEGKAGLPLLNMIDVDKGNEIVHSDINALVVYGPSLTMSSAPDGPYEGKLGHFPKATYPLESVDKRNPTLPNRLEPFREYTIAFHDEVATKQAFPKWFEDPVLGYTLHGVRDSFMINYGSGGIGSEIIASRLRVGPPHDCVNCAYEEFFLTAFTVADVAMLADIPANFGLEDCTPTLAGCEATGPKANYALFPDDPSNVHHSYTGDFVKMRNVHAGPGEQHVFHQHNHQWLFNPNDDNSNFLDAQGIGPGAGYSYEYVNGGSGNRNKTSGDAIFHCHFYPHFAQGMWEMWRNHDVYETGTDLQVSAGPDGVFYDNPVTGGVDESADNGRTVSFVVDGLGVGDGTPAPGARALPDPEIIAGTPIPSIIPLPGKPLPPMPVANVTVRAHDSTVCVGPSPTFGLAAKNAGGSCDLPFVARSKGSLAVVPAPLEGDFGLKTAGYPFWIAGIEHTVGQRPPTPPLDMITQVQAASLPDVDPMPPMPDDSTPDNSNGLWSHDGMYDSTSAADSIAGFDGGLPRFAAGGYSEGSEAIVSVLEARLDLSKEVTKVKPYFFPEQGTLLEKYAMAYHAVRKHASFSQQAANGSNAPADFFILNGARPVPGAPYQEPCIDDEGVLLTTGVIGNFFDGDAYTDDGLSVHGSSPFNATNPRIYKGANVQIDAVFNKIGYHYPQQRIIALWEDVVPSVTKERPPEPLVMRINTFDCTQYVHSNVVPKTFELDDYQVRTPTDIIGQHIHLPKWDLTTADGAANGWNYEDGTLSPGAVVEMIHAINQYQDDPLLADVLTDVEGNPVTNSEGQVLAGLGPDDLGTHLEPLAHPFFGETPYGECPDGPWCGARSTIQRWFADPVVNVQDVDRGLGIIFSHDHYGPSTHQQIGLYSTVLIEPAGSKWLHNETGELLHNTAERSDGGPTSWQAAILTGDDGIGGYTQNVSAELVENYREFYFEYSDFQHAYQPDVYVGAGPDGMPLAEYYFTDSGLPVGGPGQTANGTVMADQGALAPDPNSFRDAVAPGFRQQAEPTTAAATGPMGFEKFPTDIWEFPQYCPGTTFVGGMPAVIVPRPCPEAISANDPGMYVVNYRNESLAARVFDPNRDDCPDDSDKSDGLTEHGGCQAKGKAGDLAYAMSSSTTRAIPELNDVRGLAPATYNDGTCALGVFCPPINQVGALAGGDPFTPMMRAYEGDRVHIKVQAGAHEEEHSISVHGLKWLQAGSGFGEAKNSGWRSGQPAGISEQFSFRMPVIADQRQTGNIADYAYNINSSLDGWIAGTWGVLRTHRSSDGGGDLHSLPGNDGGKVLLPKGMNGVCPSTAPLRKYDITAVLAEDVLPGIGVTITDPYPNSHEGRSPEGPGTLVYNSRLTTVAGTVEARGSVGPTVLHDPTAILYVMTDDLEADDPDYTGNGKNITPNDPRCWRMEAKAKYDPSLPTCPVNLKSTAAVEPIVIRANAGDCIEVKLRNKLLQQARTDDVNSYPIYNDTGKFVFEDEGYQKHLEKGLNADTDDDGIGDYVVLHENVKFDRMPDLATGNATQGMVRRDDENSVGAMTTFQTNLMAPSACIGLHPTLVEYDVTKADGTAVGTNIPSQEILCPNQTLDNTSQWYAGHINPVLTSTSKRGRQFEFETIPIEFGGFNIMAADKVEQGQKGAVGAGVIYPQGSTWTVDAGTNTEATVTLPNGGGTFRDFVVVAQKGASMFYSDSFPVENILGEGRFGVAEDSQDMGQMAINYGTEPLWFRFGLNPTDAPGFMLIRNVGDAYSNTLVGPQVDPTSDPQTAVFNVTAGEEFRKHVLMPFGPGRGSTYNLHGHVWQRDPYVCEGSADLGLTGKCDMGNGHAGVNGTGEVGSKALGINPIGFYIGGIESWFPSEHWEIFIPSAGGANGVTGDYLFRDHMGLGNAQGLWGLIRVERVE